MRGFLEINEQLSTLATRFLKIQPGKGVLFYQSADRIWNKLNDTIDQNMFINNPQIANTNKMKVSYDEVNFKAFYVELRHGCPKVV